MDAAGPAKRAEAIEQHHARAFNLADRAGLARIIDETWRTLPELARYYPFDSDGRGGTFYSGVRGPEYVRGLRRFAQDRGATIMAGTVRRNRARAISKTSGALAHCCAKGAENAKRRYADRKSKA